MTKKAIKRRLIVQLVEWLIMGAFLITTISAPFQMLKYRAEQQQTITEQAEQTEAVYYA